MGQLVLTPTPALGSLQDQIVVADLLVWRWLILPQAAEGSWCQLKAASQHSTWGFAWTLR